MLVRWNFRQLPNYIPSSSPPELENNNPRQQHRAFYSLRNDPVFDDSTQVVVGAYGDL